MKAKVWIARDRDGELYLYNEEPERKELSGEFLPPKGVMLIDKNSHPEITWENSPQQIEV